MATPIIVECPTRNDLPSYNYLIELDGVSYILAFTFNARMSDGAGKWFVSIADQNNNPIAGRLL